MKQIFAWLTAAALVAGPMLGCKSEKKAETGDTAQPGVTEDGPFVLHLVEVEVREQRRAGQAGEQDEQGKPTAAAARGEGTTGDTTAAATRSGQAGDEDEMKPLSQARKELRQLEETVDELAPQAAENLQQAAAVGDFIEITDGVRVAGDKKIELPRSVRIKMDAWDQTEADITTRVCVSRDGIPVSVTILDSSGFTEADDKVEETIMKTWRYRPYLANGEPIPVCERITFRYELPHADTTKPVLF